MFSFNNFVLILGPDFNRRLKSLLDNAEITRRGGNVTKIWFEEAGRWLQYMVLMNSGNRLQAVELIRNHTLGTSFSVLYTGDDKEPIKLSTEDLLAAPYLSMKLHDGKTDLIEIQLPLDLAVGICNYYTIKKSLGFQITGTLSNVYLFTN